MSLSQNTRSYSQSISQKIIDPVHLEGKVAQLRHGGQTIATLNGSFDLMHSGHLEMIYQASLQANFLIVALNSDQSIREYKSVLRPIISLNSRLQMMAALSMVDYVTWFDETDPRQILSCIRPDVHVNGTEYGDNCIEAKIISSYGGRLHIVPLVPGFSTSQIIKKIVETCG